MHAVGHIANTPSIFQISSFIAFWPLADLSSVSQQIERMCCGNASRAELSICAQQLTQIFLQAGKITLSLCYKKMEEFMTPAQPDDLWDPDSELPLRLVQFTDFTDFSPQEIGDAAESNAKIPIILLTIACAYFVSPAN